MPARKPALKVKLHKEAYCTHIFLSATVTATLAWLQQERQSKKHARRRKMAQEPDIEAEIFYSLTTRQPVSSTIRLGPLDSNCYLLWRDLETDNFKKICDLLDPTCFQTSHLYYQLEMARQLAEHEQNPDWIFARLKLLLAEARDQFVPAAQVEEDQREALRVRFQRRMPVLFQTQNVRLSAPTDATEVLDFQDCCARLIDQLELYEIGLNGDRESDEFWIVEQSVMEAKWRLESLLEFHKNVVQKTSHPADLSLTCYTGTQTYSYCRYDDLVDANFSNRYGRKTAQTTLRLEKNN